MDELKYRKLHKLDPEYRRRMYQLVEPYLSPISNPAGQQVVELQKQVSDMDAKLEEIEKLAVQGTKGSRIAIILALKQAREELAASWLFQKKPGHGFMMPPPELRQLDQMLKVLEDPASTPLSVYKAQKRFERIDMS